MNIGLRTGVLSWLPILTVSLLLARESRADLWPREHQVQLLESCKSGANADPEICDCALASAMKRWPRSATFWNEFDKEKGFQEFVFLASECGSTVRMRNEVSARLSARLGTDWTGIAPADRASLEEGGYRFDRGLVLSTSGRTRGAPAIATVRVSAEIVVRESFLKTMSAIDAQEFCAKSRPKAEASRAAGAFDRRSLTYRCETISELSRFGVVKSVYFWQFYQNRIVILEAMIRLDGPPVLDMEIRRAYEFVVERLSAAEAKPSTSTNETDRVLTPAELYAQASPGVGYLVAWEKLGSVVVVSKNRVVTNWHVVRGTTSDVLPIVHVGAVESEAVLVGADEEQDLAVLQILRGEFQGISPRRVELPVVGERVFTIGSPQGLENTLAEGLVSSLRRLKNRTLLQVSAAISLGSSGGGLFDDRGNLVGITTATIEGGQQLNFAVPSAALDRLLGNLFTHPAIAPNAALLRADGKILFRTSLSPLEAERFARLSSVAAPVDAGVIASSLVDQGSVSDRNRAATAISSTWMGKAELGKPIYAIMKTSRGNVTLKLWSDRAPRTVANFVGLASGEKDWRNPTTGKHMRGTPFYDGLIFHRVIREFIIQSGCPLGTGKGDPGYSFEDECDQGCTFDKPGLVAMANAGPDTNGSHFFITTSMPTYLNNKHTIFGEVVNGYDVVQAISKVPTSELDRPLKAITIKSLTLSDTPP